jgi:hypothetical protein
VAVSVNQEKIKGLEKRANQQKLKGLENRVKQPEEDVSENIVKILYLLTICAF